ncbi:MAG: bacteriocin [Flammeovirgaceae bacterium]
MKNLLKTSKKLSKKEMEKVQGGRKRPGRAK